MSEIAIFGAGQIGSMLANLIKSSFNLICFADNYEPKQGTKINDVPVFSVKQAIEFNPEYFLLGVIDDERSLAMEKQLQFEGYTGKIIRLNEMNFFDIRLAMARLYAKEMNANNLPGDIAELGVYLGDFAAELNKMFPERKLHLFDTFAGFIPEDVEIEIQGKYSKAVVGDFSDTNTKIVLDKMNYPQNVIFYKGDFLMTSATCLADVFFFVSLDADLYNPTKQGLDFFWPKLVKNGVILVHDYQSGQFKGVKKAVDEFLDGRVADGIEDFCKMPICDMHGSLLIVKT